MILAQAGHLRLRQLRHPGLRRLPQTLGHADMSILIDAAARFQGQGAGGQGEFRRDVVRDPFFFVPSMFFFFVRQEARGLKVFFSPSACLRCRCSPGRRQSPLEPLFRDVLLY